MGTADSKTRGNVSVSTALIGGVSMVLASAFAAWATVTTGVADVRMEVSVVQERENNHYAEVQKQLETINNKLDQAPWAQNKSVAP